jgi:hypothetical protein
VEFEKRLSELEKSNIMTAVLGKARELISGTDAVDEDQDADNADIDQDSGDFLEADAPTEPAEEDLEDQPGTPEGANFFSVVRNTDEGEEVVGDEAERDEEEEVSYDGAVEALMSMMLSEELSKHHDFKNNPVACPLCMEDDTAEQELKVDPI